MLGSDSICFAILFVRMSVWNQLVMFCWHKHQRFIEEREDDFIRLHDGKRSFFGDENLCQKWRSWWCLGNHLVWTPLEAKVEWVFLTGGPQLAYTTWMATVRTNRLGKRNSSASLAVKLGIKKYWKCGSRWDCWSSGRDPHGVGLDGHGSSDTGAIFFSSPLH